MTILAQRDGVRVLGIRKCGHISIINTFLMRADELNTEKLNDKPQSINSGDKLAAMNAYRGDLTNCGDWPAPNIMLAFIRDPVRRALSAYHHFLIRTVRENFITLGFEPNITFLDFARHLATIDPRGDPHLAPYIDAINEAGFDDIPYVIAPLELIDQCWPTIINNLGLDCPTQILHIKHGSNYNPDDFLVDEEAVDLIRRVYSDDYELWEFIYHEARKAFSSVNHQTH